MKSKKIADNSDLWAIRGVSQEARNAAKLAAKKSNQSLGAWLSRKIIEIAQTDLTTRKKEIVRQEDVLGVLENLSNKFEKDFSDLRHQIETMKSQKKTWIQSLFDKSSK